MSIPKWNETVKNILGKNPSRIEIVEFAAPADDLLFPYERSSVYRKITNNNDFIIIISPSDNRNYLNNLDKRSEPST
jgi:hypothetical protein